MPDKTTMQLACEERQDFVDFLDGLSAEQWERLGLLPEGTVAKSPKISAPQF